MMINKLALMKQLKNAITMQCTHMIPTHYY